MKKKSKNYFVMFLLFFAVTKTMKAQVAGDFRTNSTATFTGNWNTSTSWERYNGSTWDASGSGSNNPGQIPSSTTSVWIQTTAIITLTLNASCNDLHICTNTISGVSPTALGIINLQTYSLNVNGKLRCYYGTISTIPGTSSTSGYSIYPFTGTSGKVSIVGNSRNITNAGEWSATISVPSTGIFPLEINLNSNQTATMVPNIKCSSLCIVSGTFDIVTGTMYIDNGTDGQGDITIANGGAFNAATSSVNIFERNSTKRCGTLTINSGGTLNITGGTPRMDVNAIVLNGTVNYAKSGAQNFLQKNNDASSADINVYSGITISATGNKSLSVPITVNGTILLSAGTLVTAGNLTLNSSGSLIYNGGTISGFTLPSTFNNFTPNTGTTSLSGNLTLNGTLTLANNTLDIAGNALSLNGDFTTGSGVLKSNGSATINIGGTGSLTNNLLFDQTTLGTTNRLQNFSLNRGTSTSSGSTTLGNTLEVTRTLTLINGTLNSGGTLTLVSNASGTASISSILGSADILGNIKVQRYVPALARQYRMFSPNTSSFTFSDIIDNIFVSGPGGITNGFDNSTLNGNTIYTYQENTGGSGRGWKGISAITNSLSPGVGALVFVRGDRTLSGWYTSPFPSQNAVTVDFNGPVNKGTISPAITFTSTSDTSSDGWNLVGNPYPSQIDWSTVSTNGIDGNFWILNPSTGSYYGNNSGIIASGQAFFIHAISSSPSIIFSENNKTSATATNFFKTSNPLLSIKMIADSVHSDITNLEFATGASTDFIYREDILKMYNSTINIGFITANRMNVQNNVVPFIFAASDTFNLFISASTGTFILDFSGQSSISSNYSIYLIDNFTSTIQDIRTNPEYTFSITSNPLSIGNNRFKIIFQTASTLPIKLLNFSASKISKTNDILLKWNTSSEKNCNRFIIERAEENITGFSEIASVKAIGNSNSVTNYSYIDKDILSKNYSTVFYKLIEIDNNGEITFSELISTQQSLKNNPFELYPNPAKQFLNIKFSSQTNTNFHVSIFNSNGICCIEKEINDVIENAFQITINSLAEGIYILKTENKTTGEITIQKFTKE